MHNQKGFRILTCQAAGPELLQALLGNLMKRKNYFGFEVLMVVTVQYTHLVCNAV
jgi:hypothetical protein